MKLLPIFFLATSFSAHASLIQVDLSGTMSDGFYTGQTIQLSMLFDTSMLYQDAFIDPSAPYRAYYEWAASGSGWISASADIGGVTFDLGVDKNVTEGLMLADNALGANSDSWSAWYQGQKFTPTTPGVNADAIRKTTTISATIGDVGGFIAGLGPEQVFDLTGILGTGSFFYGTTLLHDYNPADETFTDSTEISSFSGLFNIASVKSSYVPEPGSLGLLATGIVGLIIGSRLNRVVGSQRLPVSLKA